MVTVGQFSDCVGSEPGWYSAYYGMQAPTPGLTYHLALYFPEQGYVTTSTGYTERDEPTPDPTADFSLDDVIINTPTSLSDLYEQRWGFPIEAALDRYGNPLTGQEIGRQSNGWKIVKQNLTPTSTFGKESRAIWQ